MAIPIQFFSGILSFNITLDRITIRTITLAVKDDAIDANELLKVSQKNTIDNAIKDFLKLIPRLYQFGIYVIMTYGENTPRVGLEPTTYRLTVGRSTIELTRNKNSNRIIQKETRNENPSLTISYLPIARFCHIIKTS